MREKFYTTYDFEGFIDRCIASSESRESKLNRGLIAADRVDAVKLDMSSKYLQLTIAKYSAGYYLYDLVDDLKKSIDYAYESWNGFWNLKSQDREVLNQYVLSAYNDMLSMLSLAYLLNIPDNYFQKIVDVIDRDGVRDCLYEFIISAKFKTRKNNTEESYHKDYMGIPEFYYSLREAIVSPDNKLNEELIRKFISTEWYNNHTSAGRLKNHKSKHQTYYGYWSFETAAVIKIMQLDDSDMSKLIYYPQFIDSSMDLTRTERNNNKYKSHHIELRLEWDELTSILDALQVASGQTYGKIAC